jgi:hypothetical protein
VRTFFASTPERFVALLNFNVLQCIVVSVLLVRWLLSLKMPQSSLLRILKVLILAIGLVTPLVWLAAPHLPMWIATVLSREYLSFFPLFPYAGFAFAGAAWGLQCNMAQHCGSEAQFLHNSILLGGVVFVGSTVLAGIPWPPLYAEFWWSSPWYLWMRIGVLVLMCAYLRRAELAATGRPGRLQSIRRTPSGALRFFVQPKLEFGTQAWHGPAIRRSSSGDHVSSRPHDYLGSCVGLDEAESRSLGKPL